MSCSETHGRGKAPLDGGPEPAADAGAFGADAGPFADIDVHVSLWGFDYFEPGQGEPPIRVSIGAYVSINGGGFEGRVPGLRVTGDGFELAEAGDDQVPQMFTYQHGVRDAYYGKPVELEFRHEEASFSIEFESLAIEFTAPAARAAVPTDEPLAVAWTPAGIVPGRFELRGPDVPPCVQFKVTSKTDARATLTLERYIGDPQPPCYVMLSGSWAEESTIEGTPFRSFELRRELRRLQGIYIE